MTAALHATTVADPDGATVEIFPLPTDEASLEDLLRELFEQHWDKITFGPLIQGAAWEIRTPNAPTHIGMLDGYLTVAFGVSHLHLCIGPHKGPPNNPAPEALAHHRRTARAWAAPIQHRTWIIYSSQPNAVPPGGVTSP